MDLMLVFSIISMNADVTTLRASIRNISIRTRQSTIHDNTWQWSAVECGEGKLKNWTIQDNMEQCRIQEWSGMEWSVQWERNRTHNSTISEHWHGHGHTWHTTLSCNTTSWGWGCDDCYGLKLNQRRCCRCHKWATDTGCSNNAGTLHSILNSSCLQILTKYMHIRDVIQER